MALAWRMRLFGARPRSAFFPRASGIRGRNAWDRAFFRSNAEVEGQALTLENLGFMDDSHDDHELELNRDPPRERRKRQQNRISERAPRDHPPVTHAPSAEEMKRAALDASYILAGIAGMQIRRPKRLAVTEAATTDSRGAEQQEVEGVKEEEEEEEELNAELRMTTSVVEETVKPVQVSALNHPWPEWIEFLTDLQTKGFFEGSEEGVEEGKHLFESYAAVKHATHAFGRTHSEIFNFLSRKDLRVLANFGCPDLERKASNASKRLRAHFCIPEGDVCQRCRLKMTCPKAFLAPETNIRMNTLDVARIITGFATNAWPDADNYTSYPMEVGISVCNLLREFLTYKILPRKLAENEDVPMDRTSLLEPEKSVRKRVKSNPPVDLKPGDWACPNCQFLNFNRNRRCRECRVFRPQQEQNAYIGDWHCPECRYMNFSKNRYCRECNVERPTKLKWMGGERLPDDHHQLSDNPCIKERMYEASDDDDDGASDVSLINCDESMLPEKDTGFSEEEEKALLKGLSSAARRLTKATFRWDETMATKEHLSERRCANKAVEVPMTLSKHISGMTSGKQ